MTEKLEREHAIKLIERLHKRFSGDNHVHGVDTLRQQHYYNDPTADPPVIKGWEGHAKQTTWLRDTLVKLVARLTENAWKGESSAPYPSSTLQAQASECEQAFQWLKDDIEDATGVSIQNGLAYGLGMSCYAVLHWCLKDETYNGAVLDYDERDDLSEFDDEDSDDVERRKAKASDRKRYTEEDYRLGRTKKKKYRETEDSLLERRAAQRAMAGSPWHWEVMESTKFAYVRDRNPIGEFKYGLVIKELDLIDWYDSRPMKREDLNVQAAPTDVLEGGTSDTWRPSADDMEKRVVFYQLWSRDWIYEWVKGLPVEGEMESFRVIPNRQKMVPFAICPGNVTLSDDPVLAYEPALTSMFRLKPQFDRLYMNYGILAESSAVPRYILVNPSDKALPPLADEQGHVELFGDHALAANFAPEGYVPQRLGGDGIGGDFVKFLEWSQMFMEKAMPSTGHSEISKTTAAPAPWTMRILQTEANIEPAMYIDHMAAALRIMVRNIAEVNGDEKNGPGDLCFYPKDAEGKKGSSVVVIKPEQWRGLKFDASILGTSSVEQITALEHMREYAKELYGPTEVEVIEKGEGLANAEKVWAERKAFRHTAPVVDNIFKQRVAAWAGDKFLLTPNLQIGDATGRMVTPSEALMAAGQQPTPQPAQPIPAGGGATSFNPQQRMPDMAQQPGNGMATQGLVG